MTPKTLRSEAAYILSPCRDDAMFAVYFTGKLKNGDLVGVDWLDKFWAWRIVAL